MSASWSNLSLTRHKSIYPNIFSEIQSFETNISFTMIGSLFDRSLWFVLITTKSINYCCYSDYYRYRYEFEHPCSIESIVIVSLWKTIIFFYKWLPNSSQRSKMMNRLHAFSHQILLYWPIVTRKTFHARGYNEIELHRTMNFQ